MNIKKILFGNIDYYKENDSGKEKIQFNLKGGLLPSVIILVATIGFLYWSISLLLNL